MRSAVAGATFIIEFAPYAMQGPPLKRHTHQRLTEFDYNKTIYNNEFYILIHSPNKRVVSNLNLRSTMSK